MTQVLFVDDDLMSLQLMAKASLLLGYQALTCASPLNAVEMAREMHPDVIVVDMNMHEMDGIALIRAIRLDLVTQDIPIIVLTATDIEQGLPPTHAAGANGYLSKPVDFDELSAAIDRVQMVRNQ
jgi:CheY-like chemotaxis protein